MEEDWEGARESARSQYEGALHGGLSGVGDLLAVLPAALTLCVLLWTPLASRGGFGVKFGKCRLPRGIAASQVRDWRARTDESNWRG